MKKSKIFKWALLIALATWFTFSFIVLIGEEDPKNPLTLIQFFFMKAGALASTLVTGFCFARLNEKGFLPDLSKLIGEEE